MRNLLHMQQDVLPVGRAELQAAEQFYKLGMEIVDAKVECDLFTLLSQML